jgi:hypothetical protein
VRFPPFYTQVQAVRRVRVAREFAVRAAKTTGPAPFVPCLDFITQAGRMPPVLEGWLLDALVPEVEPQPQPGVLSRAGLGAPAAAEASPAGGEGPPAPPREPVLEQAEGEGSEWQPQSDEQAQAAGDEALPRGELQPTEQPAPLESDAPAGGEPPSWEEETAAPEGGDAQLPETQRAAAPPRRGKGNPFARACRVGGVVGLFALGG